MHEANRNKNKINANKCLLLNIFYFTYGKRIIKYPLSA